MHLIIILWQRMAMPLPGRNIRTGDLSKSIREPFSPPPVCRFFWRNSKGSAAVFCG